MTRFTPQIRALEWLTANPIAHRGLHNSAMSIVENSATAFAAAISNNYAIECDLQLSHDGEAMVFHDETLDRLTDQRGWVKNYTSRRLKSARFKHGPDKMQTLDELLEQVDGRVTLVIELKSLFDGNWCLAKRAIDILSLYRGPHCLMSFDPDMIAAVAALSPGTIRGITADRTTDAYYSMLPVARRLDMRHFRHLEKTRPHFISFNFRDLPFTPVQSIRAKGYPIISWTIRSREEEQQALRYSDQVTFEDFLS
jgi:glycerophosphoryl diester phosphodiesterase